MRRIFPLVCLLFVATFPVATATAAKPGSGTALEAFLREVRKTTLPNGLTLITKPQQGTGVVAIDTWVKAGYFNETDEIAGMAHLFEHMFFKGSKAFPGAEQISHELAAIGGQTNAGTIYDSTNYYFVVPKESFRRAAEIQADAIMNPLFDPEELRKEAEVVIEESNRKYDNAPAVSLERMYATAFTQHRMKRWRIGSNEVLRNIKRENLLAFFDSVYRPENMVVSIAGDVTHEEALAVVQQTFGALARGRLDLQLGPKEPAQSAFRFGQSAADIKQGYSVLGWHTPGVGDADELALDVLAALLGDGRSSRLYVKTIGPGAASTATASHDTFGDVGVFSIQTSFDEKSRAEVERRTLAEVERMKAWGPTEFELQLAKNRLESELVLSLQDALGQARHLAQFEARYGYAQMGLRLAALQDLTPKQVREIAQRYLRIDNLTLYHYAPKGTPEITREEALASVRAATAKTPDAIAALPLPATGTVIQAAAADRPARELRLSNGARLVVRERPGAPVISTSVYFKGGRSDEDSRNAGITQLMARTLRKGTRLRSGGMLDQQIEYLGSHFNLVVEADYFGLGFDILNRNYRQGLALLADMLRHPAFPEQGVEEERFQQLGLIKRSYDSSMARPLQMAFEAMYEGHPYGLPANGYPSSLARLDAARLRAWHAARINAEDALIVIVGDVSADAARRIAEANFGWLPKRTAPRITLASPTPPAVRKDVIEYRDRKQSAMVFLFPTVVRTHADWPALRLLGNVTSGLAGTFFAELRGKKSLAYSVFAQDNSRAADGLFLAYMATDASKEETAKQALLDEIRRLPVDEFSETDVSTARTYFSGSTRIARQTNAALNRELATNSMFGLGLDFTDRLLATTARIGLDELRGVAKKYLVGGAFVGAVQKGKP
ncbi:MAG: pitrilysin family protein [Sterolibacterium sp.]|jgi:zinc protease